VRPSDFKRWRKTLGLSQKQAAEALGLKRRMVQYYETGQRDGEKVAVPKTVRLACYALTSGVADYHGPDAKQEAESAGGDSDSSAHRGRTDR
jgi:transcriptional regulator with XRE-family HTH domain